MPETNDQYPDEVEVMHAALSRLPGVTGLESSIQTLDGLTAEYLSYTDLADLPHGALRRTGGGLEGEALVQVEFRLEPATESWRTLEFLAWFVREQARGGEHVQLRPWGLQPLAGNTVQLGKTLKFQIDIFCPGLGDDIAQALDRVGVMAAALDKAIETYGSTLGAH